MQERALSFIVLLVLLLSACQQESAVPTLIPTALEPTVTVDEAATEAPQPTARPRPTLPPTWTPESGMTDATQAAPESVGGATPQQPAPDLAPTLPEACNSFGPDPNRTTRTYKAGEDTTVYWVPVEGAEFYSVSLTDENGDAIFTDYTAESSYVFSADLIEDGKLYGWEVYPINALQQQMCLTRGAELFPEYLN